MNNDQCNCSCSISYRLQVPKDKWNARVVLRIFLLQQYTESIGKMNLNEAIPL